MPLIVAQDTLVCVAGASHEARRAQEGQDDQAAREQGLSRRAVGALTRCFRITRQLLAEGMQLHNVSHLQLQNALHLLENCMEREAGKECVASRILLNTPSCT